MVKFLIDAIYLFHYKSLWNHVTQHIMNILNILTTNNWLVGSLCMFWSKRYQWNVHFGRFDDMMAWPVNTAIPNIDVSKTTVALLESRGVAEAFNNALTKYNRYCLEYNSWWRQQHSWCLGTICLVRILH